MIKQLFGTIIDTGTLIVLSVVGLLVLLFVLLASVFRIFANRCPICGGCASEHINGKEYCDNCNTRVS